MTKTDETLEVLKKKCKQVGYGELEVRLIIYQDEIIGFDQLKEPIIKFRIPKKD
jgi:hypothetical protein